MKNIIQLLLKTCKAKFTVLTRDGKVEIPYVEDFMKLFNFEMINTMMEGRGLPAENIIDLRPLEINYTCEQINQIFNLVYHHGTFTCARSNIHAAALCNYLCSPIYEHLFLRAAVLICYNNQPFNYMFVVQDELTKCDYCGILNEQTHHKYTVSSKHLGDYESILAKNKGFKMPLSAPLWKYLSEAKTLCADFHTLFTPIDT